MHEFIRQNPGIRLLIPLILGISIAERVWSLTPLVWMLIAACSFLFILITHTYSKFKPNFWFGISVFAAITWLGIFIGQTKKLPDATFQEHPSVLHVRTLTVPKPGKTTYSCELQVLSIKKEDVWEAVDFNVLGHFKGDSLVKNLMAGEELLIKSTINTSTTPKNPFGFDTEKFLKAKKLKGSVFINKGDWIKTERRYSNIKLWALNLRNTLVNQFKKAGLEGQNLAVASALSLGYKDSLDASLTTAYAASGTVHLLAVSGMHVAIVVMVLNFLLSFMNQKRELSILKSLIMLTAIWFYAFLTGLSPSVIRATVMFTFILMANLLDKKSSIYNSIALSAFFILFFKPYYLYDIGFQLSYLAVIGIVFFYPIIEGWVQIPNKAGRYIWQLMAVSIAAQLITTPLILLYFKQFPVYFLVSNVIVVFIGTFVLYGSLLLLVISPIPILAIYLGKGLNLLTEFLNFTVTTISSWPNAVIQNINITNLQCLFLYIIMAGITAFFLIKQYKYLMATVFSIILLQLTVIKNNITLLNRNVVCIYHTTKGPAIQFINGKQCVSVISSDTLRTDSTLIDEALLYWQIKPKQNHFISDTSHYSRSDFYFSNGIWISKYSDGLLLNQTNGSIQPSDSLLFDYLILTRLAPKSPSEELQKLKFKTAIIDATIPVFLFNKYEYLTQNSKNEPYFVKERGAFITHFE